MGPPGGAVLQANSSRHDAGLSILRNCQAQGLDHSKVLTVIIRVQISCLTTFPTLKTLGIIQL